MQQPRKQFLQAQLAHRQQLHPFAQDSAHWGQVPNAGQYYELGFGHDTPLMLPDASQHGGPVYTRPVHNGNFRSAVLRSEHVEHAGHRDTNIDLAPGARRSQKGTLSAARSGRQTPLERWLSFVPDVHTGYVDADEQVQRLLVLTSEYQGLPGGAWYGLSPIN